MRPKGMAGEGGGTDANRAKGVVGEGEGRDASKDRGPREWLGRESARMPVRVEVREWLGRERAGMPVRVEPRGSGLRGRGHRCR